MGYKLDETGWSQVFHGLVQKGYTGSLEDLRHLFLAAAEDRNLRRMANWWAAMFHPDQVEFINRLIAVGKGHFQNFTIVGSDVEDANLVFSTNCKDGCPGVRLQALSVRITPREVYCVVKVEGDWRDCRTFRFADIGEL